MTDRVQPIVPGLAPGCDSESPSGDVGAAPFPDRRQQELTEIVEAMEDEASGARAYIERNEQHESEDLLDGFDKRAEALEDYARRIRKLLPESDELARSESGNATAQTPSE